MNHYYEYDGYDRDELDQLETDDDHRPTDGEQLLDLFITEGISGLTVVQIAGGGRGAARRLNGVARRGRALRGARVTERRSRVRCMRLRGGMVRAQKLGAGLPVDRVPAVS